jgi:hypothetical protein
MGMSQSYGPADDQESITTIHRALELGVTPFDAVAPRRFPLHGLIARLVGILDD